MLRSAPTLALAGSLFATALLLDQRFWVPATAPLAQEAALCAQGTDQGCLSTSVQPPQGLEDVLRQVPPTREVLVALGDSNMLTEADGAPSMFTMWLQCILRLRLPNYLVVAIDEKMRDYCQQRGIKHFHRRVEVPAAQAGQRASQATIKFEIVQEFLALGYSVLLSDLDVVTLQNPFDHLHRDADLECMTDGSTAGEAYGQIYGVEEHGMGWSVYGEGIQHRGLNAGVFYVKANQRGLDLMAHIARRVASDGEWDQRLFNQEIFVLSHGNYTAPQASVRVMDITQFMNSKVLWLGCSVAFQGLNTEPLVIVGGELMQVRFQPKAQQPEPVMVHINHHPDKPRRMQAAIEYFIQGSEGALAPFPDKQFQFSLHRP